MRYGLFIGLAIISTLSSPAFAAMESVDQVEGCQASSGKIITNLNELINNDTAVTETDRGNAQDYIINNKAEIGRWFRNACSTGAVMKKGEAISYIKGQIEHARKAKTIQDYAISMVSAFGVSTGAAIAGNLPKEEAEK